MWLTRGDIGEAQEIDTQYIHASKDTIEYNIVRIVEQAVLSGSFDRYIDRFEYTCRCFDRGNELFEQEMEANANSGGPMQCAANIAEE